jgi:hypothetical protein
MRRWLISLTLISFSFIFSSCETLHWSVSPYAAVNGSQNGNDGWQAGVSVTFFDRIPAVPAVPNQNNVNVKVSNDVQQVNNQEQNQQQDQNQKAECPKNKK